MAQLNEVFDVNALPKSERSFEPLPAGWYTVTITGADIKQTKAGTGEYIAVRYDVVGPTHQGRVVFGNLNIKNPNPTAESIGRQQLGELMRAAGFARLEDTDQLIGGQLSIKLDIRKSEQYGDSNDVKGFKSINGGAMPTAASAETQAPKATSAKAAPPWVKK
jgi:hypothetical protein